MSPGLDRTCIVPSESEVWQSTRLSSSAPLNRPYWEAEDGDARIIVSKACQLRKLRNIQSLEELGEDLVHPLSPAVPEVFSYFSKQHELWTNQPLRPQTPPSSWKTCWCDWEGLQSILCLMIWWHHWLWSTTPHLYHAQCWWSAVFFLPQLPNCLSGPSWSWLIVFIQGLTRLHPDPILYLSKGRGYCLLGTSISLSCLWSPISKEVLVGRLLQLDSLLQALWIF